VCPALPAEDTEAGHTVLRHRGTDEVGHDAEIFGDNLRPGFLEHLEELRSRLIKSVIAIGVCVFVCTAYTPAIVRFLKAPAAKYGVELVGYGGWEMFSLYFDVAFAAGLSLAAPLVLFQIWKFIEPALYPHERRYARPFLISTTLFFVLGAAFGYFFATPYIIELSRDLAALMEITWRPGALEYVSLLTWTVVAMGIVFEMPPIVFIQPKPCSTSFRFCWLIA